MNKFKKTVIALAIGATTLMTPMIADACTKITYVGANGNVLTGNNMDWDRGFDTDLWVLPAGLQRSGQAELTVKSPNDLHWTSKYGSVIITSNGMVHDGLNEKGMSVTVHYDAYAEYSQPQKNRKDVSLAFFNQYILDNFATVTEAIKGVQNINAIGVPLKLENGHGFDMMFGITDASGDNAVFQWEKGVLKVYHGKQYNVLANEALDPKMNFGDQYKVLDYYRGINAGQKAPRFLPGTYASEDRVSRFGYFLDIAPKESDISEATKWTFSLIRNAQPAVPFEEPNLPGVYDTTGWTSVADLKYKRYYVDVPKLLSPYYVDLTKFDLKPGAPLRKLSMLVNEGMQQPAKIIPHSGDVTNQMEISPPNPVWQIGNAKK